MIYLSDKVKNILMNSELAEFSFFNNGAIMILFDFYYGFYISTEYKLSNDYDLFLGKELKNIIELDNSLQLVFGENLTIKIAINEYLDEFITHHVYGYINGIDLLYVPKNGKSQFVSWFPE